ncbi:MAG: ABC transporter permease [Velocimicrobium sp.]
MSKQVKSNKFTNTIKMVWQDYSSLFALMILVIVASIASPKFMQLNNIMNILRQCSIIGLISIGMAFVIIGGGIDLSAGSVLAIGGGVLVFLQSRGTNLIVAIIAGCFVTMAIGLVNGLFVTKAKLAPFIVTLAVSTIARSLIIHLANGSTIIGKRDDTFSNIGNGRIGIVPVPVVIFAVIAVIAHFVLKETKYGSYVYAVGGNEKSAQYSGINVDKVKIATYVIMGFTIGIAALIESARLVSVSSSSSGNLYELDAITAVIIGGTSLDGGKGSVVGTVIGVLILGVISNIMNIVGISPYLTGAVKGVIILIAVLLQKK